MKDAFKTYFYYTSQERKGALILLFLTLGCAVAPRFYPLLFPPAPVAVSDLPAFPEAAERPDAPAGENAPGISLFPFDPNQAGERELQALGLPPPVIRTLLNYRAKGGRFRKKEDLQKVYGLNGDHYARLAPYIRIENRKPEPGRPATTERAPAPDLLFPFDPNTAGPDELLALGLPEKTIRIWIRYRDKGGRFQRKEDLRKIYGLSPEDYERLAPLVRIESGARVLASAESKPSPESPPIADLPIDINLAGAEEWQRLRGIGPGYAGRIIRFREALGGFASVEQVAETYGLPDSTFQAIRRFLVASPILHPLFINRAEAEVLAKHPYLNRKQARILCDFRRNHGPFRSAADLESIKIFSAAEIERLRPYLQFETDTGQTPADP